MKSSRTNLLYDSNKNKHLRSFLRFSKNMLTLIRLDFLKVVFSRERGEGVNSTPLHISRTTNLISMQLYTIVKQPI